MDAIKTATAGVINAANRFSASAGRIALGDRDLISETVEQINDKATFNANIAVIRASDEMQKRLLDIKV